MISYTPKAGTKTERAIECIQSLPVGTHVDTRVLGQQLDVDPCCVKSLLDAAIRHGLIATFMRARRAYFCLPESAPTCALDEVVKAPLPAKVMTFDHVDPDGVDLWPIERRVVPAAGLPAPFTQAARSVFDLGATL